MSKLVFGAALIAAAALNGRGAAEGSVETAPISPCWSSLPVEPDAALVITGSGLGAAGLVAPDADSFEAPGFTGVGWTFGNLFDDVDDFGYPLGPGDYSSADWNRPVDRDGHLSFAAIAAS